MSDSEWVIDTTAETFERVVLEQSSELPVVVDFWAAWCGPCRQLGPLLEGLAEEHGGKFLLAKVDIEANQPLAAAFRVQSIPHVVAIRDKQVVDQLSGLLPEASLRAWLSRIIPSPAEELVKLGQSIEPTDPDVAETKFREAITLSPQLPSARIALAALLERQQRFDEARQIIADLEQRGFLEPEAERLKASLNVATIAAAAGGVDAAREAAEANPNDLSLVLPLADALAAAGQQTERVDLCLSVIRQDKGGVGVSAKETMLNILNLVDDPELAGVYRRKLATLLY